MMSKSIGPERRRKTNAKGAIKAIERDKLKTMNAEQVEPIVNRT
jgi:hypothetical protein